jgi:hypothetical protein
MVELAFGMPEHLFGDESSWVWGLVLVQVQAVSVFRLERRKMSSRTQVED